MRTLPFEDPASAQSKRVAWVVLAVGVSSALHIGKLPVAIPVLREALGVTLVQAGFLLSMVQLAGMSLGLLVGLGADRFGPRRVMQIGLLVLAVASALGATAQEVQWLLASRGLEGVGFLLSVLPAPALLRQRVAHPATLSKALGWWGAYMPFGTAIALLAGTALIGVVGWRGAWQVLAGVSVLAWAVLTWSVPPPRVSHAHAMPAPLGPRLRRTLSAPGPWLVALGFFLYSGQWLAVVGFLPTVYQQAGYSGGWVAVLTALAAAVNIIGNVMAGRLLAKGVGPGRLMSFAYGVMGMGAVLAFAGDVPPMVAYLAVLLFSAVGGLIPGTLFGVSVRLAPDEGTVSTTVGWMQQLSALGQFIGPPAVAWLASVVGNWHWTGLATGACSLLGLWVAARVQGAWVGLKPR
ncbi:MFS transporter [Hydrogenophaga crassostreae]|uniref:MFS transporter n=1 Tax=Hydrogenophaga crassostreae TaxID=1763535 RepID=A0A167HHG8_9BURK|nr:MFS transporter [Hydrogenophaga crassostreae]AOW12257.1 MFS transporter [Hydrogenophaga crassostreae]OAD41205.1 MFS transporter [Hydrogenophaga crassostreae]